MVGSLLAPGVAEAAQAQQAEARPRIVVSPDYLVSRDGDRPHVEIMAAANPRNARNLLAGAITFTRRDGGSATKAYVSRDGGIVWDDVIFPEQRERGGADPQVAFTAAGTALFLTLNTAPDETGRTRAFLHSYRSEDEGVTWSDVYNLGASYDHPMLVADQTTGPFAGRLYVSVLYGGLEYSLGVFRSEDDGRSWIGPVKFIDGAGERGLNVDPMLVFADGAIMVPFIDFPFTPEQTARWDGTRIWTVVSTDGGVTFSEPRAGPLKMTGDELRGAREGLERFRGGSWVMYAVDRSERFRDRVYAVWPDYSEGLPRVVVVSTDDRGSSWSEPRPVAPTGTRGAQQFQAAVAVNRDGVLGVTWYDTREAPSEFAFHQYFAASFDGGESFTAPQRVSSALSRPMGSGNLLPAPATFSGPEGELRVALLSAASRWVSGGDYMGLTASVDGHFHPVWADARSGTYQVYTAEVRIEEGASAASAVAEPAVGEPVDVTGRIELVNDPGAYDAETGVLDLWIRLKNVSAAPIAGPIEVEIRKFGSGMDDTFAEFAPEILNADNDVRGPGAHFVYSDALGTEGVLPPGGVSGAMLWRLKLVEPIRVPNLHVYVTGREVVQP
ncbi:MAG: sialidase family protein [Gemmatimonadota bacterium]|nr:sialidase family protein [Gemmatimonadota bacterium]